MECEYFPCLHWYSLFLQSEQAIIEQYEYFERASLRNRCYIAGPNGLITLSIPIYGGRNQKTRMKDIRISYNQAWQDLHWKTIRSCYQRSPFFEFVADRLAPLFTTRYDFLLDFNLAVLTSIHQCLRLDQPIQLSSGFEQDPVQHNFRRTITAENYHRFSNHLQYPQVFQSKQPFQPNLSILDLLCCEGLNSLNLIRSLP